MQTSTTPALGKQGTVQYRHLPKDPQVRAQLKQSIEKGLQKLKRKIEKNPDVILEEKIKILELRLLMIDSCAEMSLLRLDHLEWIFKHYCIHIFKTGKHMTFQRLEYEKEHLTMERFFLFLKDFELTVTKGEKKEEVVEKNAIILLFKKMSSNCRDLSFEEFIRCIERLAVMYYDQKLMFSHKKERIKMEKQKRKEDYERRKRQKIKKNQEKPRQIKGQEGEADQQQNEIKQKEGQENDELIKDMINNKDLQDPNQQINKITNRYTIKEQEGQEDHEGQQGQQSPSEIKNSSTLTTEDDDMLLLLTEDEKIEYYYKFMVNVDSAKDYRDKLTVLNLPIFQKGKNMGKQTNVNMEKNVKTSQDQNARMEELKRKMDEKKMKQKASPIPKPKQDGIWAKAEQQKKKKRQLKKQRQQKAKQKNQAESQALLQKKLQSQKSAKEKKPQYNQKEVDWNTIGKMSIDQLKLNKFNPNKYFSKDDDDRIFLDQYDGGRIRAGSGLDRERNSMTIVEDIRKRVGEVEKNQKKQERDLEKKLGHNVAVKSRF